ncbi:cysteine-rich receptor-like protein kinase 8 [Tanacetum coccineum]|uniref:Cysteine-rich receptor-like protein kinase 8 n=1 Tax=Tanacetum coccineum TaxID=301880 RepID=A0ABQ4Y4Z1_9ASTR
MAPANNNQNMNNRNQNTSNNQPPPRNNQPPPTGSQISTIDINSPNHPLYLHPNDHAGLILILKKLAGSENYSSWKRSMMIALSAKNKLKIITYQISNNLNFVNSTSELWSDLYEHYAQLDGHRMYQLVNDIVALKQQNYNIEVYYHKLKGLWDEHDTLEAPYLCNCVCNCENGKNNRDMEQRKRLIQFLMGLDECYLNLRGYILLLQPLSIVAKAYSMIRQEEKQMEGILPKPLGSTTLSQSGRRNTFRAGVYFTNCSKEGHNSDECYRLKGYPIGHTLHEKYKPPVVKNTSVSENKIPSLCEDGSTPKPIESSVTNDATMPKGATLWVSTRGLLMATFVKDSRSFTLIKPHHHHCHTLPRRKHEA